MRFDRLAKLDPWLESTEGAPLFPKAEPGTNTKIARAKKGIALAIPFDCLVCQCGAITRSYYRSYLAFFSAARETIMKSTAGILLSVRWGRIPDRRVYSRVGVGLILIEAGLTALVRVTSSLLDDFVGVRRSWPGDRR
jgi:hypothetical protein